MITSETYEQKRQRVLEALGTYQKTGAFSDEIGDMAEMLVEESDRGCVVFLGSILEDILLEEITRSFVTLTNKEEKNLIRNGGLLSSFADRIALARALGIIDADMVGILDLFKAMRNACAHSRQHIDFATAELRETLELLFDDETVADIRTGRSNLVLRWMFILGFSKIVDRLRGLSDDDATKRAQVRMDVMIATAKEASEKHQASLEKRRKQRANRLHQHPKG